MCVDTLIGDVLSACLSYASSTGALLGRDIYNPFSWRGGTGAEAGPGEPLPGRPSGRVAPPTLSPPPAEERRAQGPTSREETQEGWKVARGPVRWCGVHKRARPGAWERKNRTRAPPGIGRRVPVWVAMFLPRVPPRSPVTGGPPNAPLGGWRPGPAPGARCGDPRPSAPSPAPPRHLNLGPPRSKSGPYAAAVDEGPNFERLTPSRTRKPPPPSSSSFSSAPFSANPDPEWPAHPGREVPLLDGPGPLPRSGRAQGPSAAREPSLPARRGRATPEPPPEGRKGGALPPFLPSLFRVPPPSYRSAPRESATERGPDGAEDVDRAPDRTLP